MDRLKKIEVMLGIKAPWCRYCDAPIVFMRHKKECIVWTFKLENVNAVMKEVRQERKKNQNKQIIFRSDVKKWSGMPSSGEGTLVRKRTCKNRGPNYGEKRCGVCGEYRLFIGRKCSICQHEKPCELSRPLCKVCHVAWRNIK